MEIKMQTVISSTIKAIGYDVKSKVLRVQFPNGVYDYSDIPEDIFKQFQQAESKGQYLKTFIKGVYSYKKIEIDLEKQKVESLEARIKKGEAINRHDLIILSKVACDFIIAQMKLNGYDYDEMTMAYKKRR